MVGQGQYSRVYKKGDFAYKVIKFPTRPKMSEALALTMKCNLKELMFFHSMTHPNVMKPMRSQVIMVHGQIRRIIHEMPAARCTLATMVRSNEITSYNDIATIFTEVGKGLAYMHDHQIIHGDIKPSNILIMPDYRYVVSDFTLTTLRNKGNEIAFGTLFWRAPECAAEIECDTPADVWSFGLMMLDCIYSCTYCQQVLNVSSNEDLLTKLVHVVGQPSRDWVSRYLPDRADLLPDTRRGGLCQAAVRPVDHPWKRSRPRQLFESAGRHPAVGPCRADHHACRPTASVFYRGEPVGFQPARATRGEPVSVQLDCPNAHHRGTGVADSMAQ